MDLASSNLSTLITDLITITNQLIVLLAGVAILVFIWSLIGYLATSDNPEKRKEWGKYMIYGVIAFAVISGLWGLVNATLNLFGLGPAATPQFNQVPDTSPGAVDQSPQPGQINIPPGANDPVA